MSHPSIVVAERVRLRLRAEGTDPSVDADAARHVALAEVRRFNDGALSRGEATIDDEIGCVRDVLAAVSGFGVLQPLLDDPTIEAPGDAREDAKRTLIEQAGRKEILMLLPQTITEGTSYG